jgi:hypothetical protein
MFEDDGEVY